MDRSRGLCRTAAWATIQRDMLDRHPWITQMPMPEAEQGSNERR